MDWRWNDGGYAELMDAALMDAALDAAMKGK